jgi:1,2-diacylglycerol 3-beta-galactosyltransferase
VAVTTHPLFTYPLGAVITIQKLPVSVVTVITDLTNVHRLWFSDAADYCLVPTQDVYEQAILNNLAKKKVQITGIPVHPNLFHETRDPAVIRSELGWLVDKTTVLVVGSKRVKRLEPVLHVLNHSGLPVQLVAVAGGDDNLFAQLQATEWHIPTTLYNFVDKMPTFLHAADCIICKAGGLIVTESLASGLPLLLVDVTPGQEEGNAAYVVDHGAGELAADPVDVLEILFHWLDHDKKILSERARVSRTLGRPRSAFVVAESLWVAAERSGLPIPESRLSLRPKIKELLNQFGITA